MIVMVVMNRMEINIMTVIMVKINKMMVVIIVIRNMVA